MKTKRAEGNTLGNSDRRRLITDWNDYSKPGQIWLEMRQNGPETAGNGSEWRRQGPGRGTGRLAMNSTPYRERHLSAGIVSFRRESGRLGMILTSASHKIDYVNLHEKPNSSFHVFMKTGYYDRMKDMGYNAAGRMMS